MSDHKNTLEFFQNTPTDRAEDASCLTFRCEGEPATATTVDIDLYGIIEDFAWDEDSLTAKQLAEALKDYPQAKTIVLNINSPGGSVFAAAAMYQILNRHEATKVVRIDGMAFSAASVVAMVGDEIHIGENAMMMIHNPSVVAWGDAAVLS